MQIEQDHVVAMGAVMVCLITEFAGERIRYCRSGVESSWARTSSQSDPFLKIPQVKQPASFGGFRVLQEVHSQSSNATSTWPDLPSSEDISYEGGSSKKFCIDESIGGLGCCGGRGGSCCG